MTDLGSDGVVGYLGTLGSDMLELLYDDMSTTSTVLRSLPPLGQQYAMRLAMCLEPLPRSVVDSWVPDSADPTHIQVISRMKTLHALSEDSGMVQLNPNFQRRIREALCVGTLAEGVDMEVDPGNNPPSLLQLSEYARSQWDRILHYIVGSEVELPTAETKALINLVGLVGEKGSITKEGSKFLFQDTHTQLWILLRGYLGDLESMGLNRIEVLRFMFGLSFRKIGNSYSKVGLTAAQDKLLVDLCRLGLVKTHSRKSKRFFVTPLVHYLSKRSQATEGTTEFRGVLMVETTFRVEAYTNSPLQLALLRMFVRIQIRLPNLIIGKITKQSVRSAFAKGITAAEIIGYMHSSVHPQALSTGIPENVTDQIRMWEQEANRATFTAAHWVHDFKRGDEFDNCRQFCEDSSILVAQDVKQRHLYVTSGSKSSLAKHFKASK